jgi:hypothetical protein
MTNLFDPTLAAAANAAPLTPPPAVLFTGLGDDAWHAASKALAPATDVVVSNLVRPFHPWQASAYAYATAAIARWGGAMVGDDMGLGKTAVLLALASDAVARTGRYAIVCAPPVVEGGYITELRACFPHLTLEVVKGHKRKAIGQADIYFISDDSRTMQTWMTDVSTNPVTGKKVITASAWVQGASLVARDEIHRDKGNGTKPTGRARVMLAVGEYCRQVGTPIVGATGTLLSNRMIEAYIPLQIVGGERLIKALTPGAHAMTAFLWRYCSPTQGVAKGGRKFTAYGTADPEVALTLHDHLRRTVYVRREKSDLGEGVLPHGGWVVAPMALPDGTMRRYARVEHDFYNLVSEERGKVWADKLGRAEALVKMGMLREEAGVAKCEAAADYIYDLVKEGGHQVVAFYDHRRVWERLALALLGKGITITTINGQVTGDDRIEAVREFQAGDVEVCLAQVKAAGIGVTLTAASEAVFVQTDWSAGALKQCADRILRADDISKARADAGEGITWHVLQAHYSDGDPTFDAHIWDVLEKKAALCDAVNAGRPVTMSPDSVQEEALMTWVPSDRHRKGGW